MLDSIIDKLIAEKGGDLVVALATKLGLDESTARTFAPIVVKFIVAKFVENRGAALTPADIDTAAIAEESGMSEEQATAGVEAVLPEVSDSLQGDSGIADLLSGKGDASDLLGAAAKGLGGLFS